MRGGYSLTADPARSTPDRKRFLCGPLLTHHGVQELEAADVAAIAQLAEPLPATVADDGRGVHVAGAVPGQVAVVEQLALLVYRIEHARVAGNQVPHVLPATEADHLRVVHVAGAVPLTVAVEQQLPLLVDGVDDPVPAVGQVTQVLPATTADHPWA